MAESKSAQGQKEKLAQVCQQLAESQAGTGWRHQKQQDYKQGGMKHRDPPFSSEAEQGVLGSMLIEPRVIATVGPKLTPEHFYIPAHQEIFMVIAEMWNNRKAIDIITVTQVLRDKERLEMIGGAAFVTHLSIFVPTAANVEHYVAIVHDKYQLRQLIETSRNAASRAYSDQDQVEDVISEYEQGLKAITSTRGVQARRSLSEMVDQKIARMERKESNPSIIKTGIDKLDLNSPLWLSDMPLISGERKAGKSILATTIASNVARNGIPVAIFSLEMSAAKIIDRLLSGISRISMLLQDRISNLSKDQMAASQAAAIVLSSLPICIYDDLHDLHHIIAECRILKEANKLGMIIVDYAQLVRVPERKERNREQEVALISRTLRLLSLELQVPLLLISQLNEHGRSRESRSLEQDATASWKIGNEDEEEPGMRWIYIEWQRDGESNIKFPITFLGYCARVENYQNECTT